MGSVGIAERVVGLGMLGVLEPLAGNSAFPCCVLIRAQLRSEISRANPTVLPPRLFGLFPKVFFFLLGGSPCASRQSRDVQWDLRACCGMDSSLLSA